MMMKSRITRGRDGRKKFSWTVEISVSETWVADGFDLDIEDLRNMVEARLPYIRPSEYAVRITAKPLRSAIKQAQGYSR